MNEQEINPANGLPGEEVKTVRKPRKGVRRVQDVLGGEYLTREVVIRNIPFLMFLAVLAILYIANTYYTERIYKDLESTKTELKELRYRYITAKSSLMFNTRSSVITEKAKLLGLEDPRIPPFRIFCNPDQNMMPEE